MNLVTIKHNKFGKHKKRTVYTGKKGGKYYISKGKKVYFGAKRKQRSDSPPKSSKKRRVAAAADSAEEELMERLVEHLIFNVRETYRELNREPTTRENALRFLATAVDAGVPGLMGLTAYLAQTRPVNVAGNMFLRGAGSAAVRSVGALRDTFFPRDWPRALDGRLCKSMPRPHRTNCERDWCRINPNKKWCRDKAGKRGAGSPEVIRAVLREVADEAARREDVARQEAANRQILAFLPEARRDPQSVGEGMRRAIMSLPPNQRAIILRALFPPAEPAPGQLSIIPPSPRFGKKKTLKKKSPKKKTKQTRK